MSSLFGSLNPEQFLATVWQQQPLLVRQALPAAIDVVDGNDLAGIACEASGEARLVLSDTAESDWQCEHGPFKAKRFKSLPPSHWTLLVQSVDQWIPEVQALLAHFSCLPRWRLDDIMISYASDGGGVGPHFDYYDVFLIQASGQRRWQIGQRCDEHTALRDNTEMKLLRDFEQSADYTLDPGDMLYLPASVAHWGTALGDDCITISVGFRAASQRELVQAALENLAETLPAHLRYRDTRASIDADPFRINDAAIEQLLALWQQLPPDSIRNALAQALGEYATEPRHAEHITPERTLDDSQLAKKLASKNGLHVTHHPASRFAWRALDLDNDKNSATDAELFVNGGVLLATATLAQAICHGHISASDCPDAHSRALLLALINQGALLF